MGAYIKEMHGSPAATAELTSPHMPGEPDILGEDPGAHSQLNIIDQYSGTSGDVALHSMIRLKVLMKALELNMIISQLTYNSN